MARRRKNKISSISKNSLQRRARYTKTIARPYRLLRRFDFEKFIAGLEDNRRWHPDPNKQPASRHKSGRRIVPSSVRQTKKATYRVVSPFLSFNRPEEVSICAKRSRRRQVLSALQKIGKTGVGRSRKRRNKYSEIRCS
jgi:hypothetical protein